MRIGLDIDGTIDEIPEFFRFLCEYHYVVIISGRSNIGKAIHDLRKLGIRYDKLVLTGGLDKAQAVIDNDIDIFFEDQDECIVGIPDNIIVFKIRNGGNYDYDNWKFL